MPADLNIYSVLRMIRDNKANTFGDILDRVRNDRHNPFALRKMLDELKSAGLIKFDRNSSDISAIYAATSQLLKIQNVLSLKLTELEKFSNSSTFFVSPLFRKPVKLKNPSFLQNTLSEVNFPAPGGCT